MKRLSKITRDLCIAGVCINTLLFPVSLFIGRERLAFFQFLCALGCWVGILGNEKEEIE
jgi:hypothetical protein